MPNACGITPEAVQEAFLQAPPLIAQQILDLSVQHPNWQRDLYSMEPWPEGAGTIMEQLVFRGTRPQIERGFDRWKKLANISGCTPCDGPDCSYNWTMFGGHGFDRKLTELMSRDFRSPSYCVTEIQTTAHFKEVFAKIVENLYAQVDFFKEFNVGHNGLVELAKKYVVDAQGAKCNPENPYVYRPIGTAKLSTLNIGMLEFFYEHMRRLPSAIPYDVVDGSPVYALLASHQLLARMYRDDPNLREDVRFSGLANDLLMKYNFMSTIRGMFIAAPILYPRRFNVVGGKAVEVLPFVNGIPAEIGVFTDLNPDYEAATLEEVLIHGKFPFKVFYYPTVQTLGEGTSFGPEDSFMNNWQWNNPATPSDPNRRVGFFSTNAKIGFSQQFSEGIFGILVSRPRINTMATYLQEPNALPTPVVVTNAVPDVGCPCPAVISIVENPMVAGNYFFRFATAVTGEASDPVTLQLDNGGSVVGELVSVSADGKTAEITFATGLAGGTCANIVGVFCDTTATCWATVDNACDCRSNQTDHVELQLSNAIRADTAGDIIVAFFGDCSQAELKVVSVDAANLKWTVQYDATAGPAGGASDFGPTDDPTATGYTKLSADMICDRGGISKVCVPPSTDAACPACNLTATACVEA